MTVPVDNSLVRDYDVIVVGAGIAGPGIAVGLAKKGRRVLVIERDLSEPDRIVGELLQPGGVEALKQLGIPHCVDGIDAAVVSGYQVFYHGDQVNIPYPALPSGKPATGRGFHHGRFVMNLRKALMNTKGITVVERTVTDMVENPHTKQVLGVKTKDKNGDIRHYFAPLTIVCDGIASKFRKVYNTNKPNIRSYFVGLDLEKVDFPSPNHGHVVIGSGQPVLFYPIDKTAARMLCDVKAPMPSISNGDMKRYLQQSVRPILPEGVVSSFDDALENGRIRYMPNQWLTATPNRTPGVLLLGDALNMRHPLTGGGMTVALSDAVTLSDLLAPENVPDLGDADHVQKVARVFFDKRKRPSAVVNVLAMALYALFAADSEDLRILQRGCFGYFMLGGECVGGPVSLLSGLESNFTVLFYHFFSVAFYSIWLNILARGILGFPIALIQAFTVLYTACVVFLPIMFQEFK